MNNKLISQIKSQISEQEVINIIKDLVKIPSYSGIKNQESEVANYIHNLFIRENIESKIIPVIDGRSNVIAKLKGTGNGKTLLLTGHLDTVPPYDMKNPFNAKIKNGMLYGRGAVDMKGSLACMISAIIGIKRAKIKLLGDVIFAGVIDEEQKSLGTVNLIENGINADAAIVGEPSNLNICLAHRGLEWLEFHIIGKTVHGGSQANGINAIQKVTNLIRKMEEKLIPKLQSKQHPLIGYASMNYGTIKGGTQPSTVAGDCYLTIDRRWLPYENYQEIIKEYKDIINELKEKDKEFNCTFKVMNESYINEKYIHEAMEIDCKHPIINIVNDLTETIYKKTPQKTYFKAWSDGGLLSSYAKIPTIIFAPGDLETAHTSKECIEISQIYPATIIYALTSINFCNENKLKSV